MKVLLLNGSPKANGNTAVALHEMVDIFNKEGIETEVIHVGNKDIRGCVACGQCSKLGHCVFNDLDYSPSLHRLLFSRLLNSTIAD